MSQPRRLIAGNWKMNGVRAALSEIVGLRKALDGLDRRCEVAVCPPFPLISAAAELVAGSDIFIGGQDCHDQDSGAHTGCVSAAMLADCGARLVIVGHSERRADHLETDTVVRAKALAASRAGLRAIVCVGESLTQRESGQADAVVRAQVLASVPAGGLSGLILAYEPVWAIGTGLTPTLDQISAAHTAARAALATLAGEGFAAQTPILYGGSVKAENAGAILRVPGVDGALVGGASLKAESFAPIVKAASA